MGKTTGQRRLSKKLYKARVSGVREDLRQLQIDVRSAPFKVLLILGGPEGAGRGSLLHTLVEWLDPRGVETFSYASPTDEERRRPHQWRFWRSLPGMGRIGLYAGSWYTETLRERAQGKRALKHVLDEAARIRRFETLLVNGGTLVIKVWLHLSKEAQGRRLRTLRSDPLLAWRVTDEDWHHYQIHDRLAKAASLIRARTNSPNARWTIIDAEDERARDLAVASLIVSRFRQHHLKAAQVASSHRPAAIRALRPAGLRRLQAIPLDQEMSDSDYAALREVALGRLNRAVREALGADRSIVFVFEGWDAAGKGGAIRRLTSAMDPRDYSVIAVAKPTEEEKHANYLWRFWRHIPPTGRVTIFDRSWYGRVLVERVEELCRPDEWKQAFTEINDFERELTLHGTIVVKYWLHISHDEQLRRFRDRETTQHKSHKLNAEDWRNRRQRPAYEIAVGDMLALTNRNNAPWHTIPADNKRYARIEVLRLATRQIEAALRK